MQLLPQGGLRMNEKLIAAIQKNLTPDLINNKFWLARNKLNPMAGHCYIASEAYFHLAGETVGPCVLKVNLGTKKFPEWSTHWFLETPMGVVIDITAAQFKRKLEYSLAKRCGFLTKGPSKRAQVLIERVKHEWTN